MAAASDDDVHARALAEAVRKSHVTLQETLDRVEMEVVRRSRIGDGDEALTKPRKTVRGYLFKQSGGKQTGASANRISFGNLMSKWDRVGASPASTPGVPPPR